MGFVNRNLVAIVMIPTIVGMHFGWSMLQDNKKLVPEGKKIDQPIYSVSNYFYRAREILNNIFNNRLQYDLGTM